VVDVALYEAAFSQMEPVVPAYEKLGLVPQREGANLPSMAPNSLYPSRDGGWVLIAANSNPTWKRLVAIMQQPELLTDPRFETIQQRGKPDNMKAIDAIISDWSRGFDAARWKRCCARVKCPPRGSTPLPTFTPTRTLPHAACWRRCPTPRWATPRRRVWCHACPATPGTIRHSGPALGENGLDILANDLHLDAARIQQLTRKRRSAPARYTHSMKPRNHHDTPISPAVAMF
jgi:crotonobetainyl-CoA:carnitine CoA-transferase CaiB-like acyl-CoA transferase